MHKAEYFFATSLRMAISPPDSHRRAILLVEITHKSLT
jgi:hypothetical protein